MTRSIGAVASSLMLSLALLVTADASPYAPCPAALTQASAPSPTADPIAVTPTRKGVPVPASIDATGKRDASAALSRWLASVPDGATILFKAGGTYRMDVGLKLSKRRDLTFEGNGATLKANGAASCGRNCSLFYLWRGNTGIKIRNFKLVGNSPTPGTYSAAREQMHGVTITGSHDIELANLTISAVGGDGFYISGWADEVWIHDSHVASNGRMGVAITAGRNVTVQGVTFDKVGYGVFDIEPNDRTGGATNVRILNNTIGSISMPYPKGFFFGANGAAGSRVDDVIVSGNTITGDTLLTYVNATRRENIVFSNNRSLVAGAGPILRFAHIDGLTVTGNVQPLCSGTLASVIDSTDATYP